MQRLADRRTPSNERATVHHPMPEDIILSSPKLLHLEAIHVGQHQVEDQCVIRVARETLETAEVLG